MGRVIEVVLWVGAIVVGGYHLGLQVVAIGLPEPMGSWETVYAAIARVWPEQYQWVNHVEGHDGYGPGYPAFVRPFLLVGFEVYVAHRLANLVAILLAGGLVVRLLLQRGCPAWATAALTAIFYALNAGSYSIQARPDFLVLLAIAVLLALGESAASGRRKLGAGFGAILGLVALAAFLTKAYALFTWGAVLGYLAVFVSLRQALVAGAVSGAVLGGGIGAFALFNPLYPLEVFQGQVVQAAPSAAWLRHQVADFSWLAGGLLLTVLVPLAMAIRRRDGGLPTGPVEPGSAVANHERYWRWQVLLAAVGLLVGPGWHTGAYLTYFLHLLLVPLVMLAGAQIAHSKPVVRIGIGLALLVNLSVLIGSAPAWPDSDPGWGELRRDVLAEPGRIAVDYLLEPIAREKPGRSL
jgi:hypothetical protein